MGRARVGFTVVAGLLGYGTITTCCRCIYPLGQKSVLVSPLAGFESAELELETDTGRVLPLRSPAPDAIIVSRKTPVLPKALDAMTNAEVGDYLRSLAYKTGGYSTQEANVSCVHADNSPCTSGDSAHVIIQPEAGMNKWKFDSIPAHGLVVARIINDAPAGRYEANFKYPPQQKTWWVVDDSAGNLRSRYFTRTYSNTGPAIIFVTNTRTFNRCVHPDAPPGRPARAKFWDCAQSAYDTSHVTLRQPSARDVPQTKHDPLMRPPVSFVSFVPVPRAARPMALASNWVTCDAGCCASQ